MMSVAGQGPAPPGAGVLAIDLGKTACRVALWQEGAPRLAEGPGAPGLAAPGGAAAAEAAILSAVAGLLDGRDLLCVAVGAAGALAAPQAAQELARRLTISLPASRAIVTSDAVTSHAGALGGQPGLVLAVGTGAVAVVLTPGGGLHQVDGLGAWLGDEGGGAAIGLAGLRAALRAQDGRGPATRLATAATRRFGTPDQLVAALNGSDNPAGLAAGFAPDVLDAADADDTVARGILAEARAQLAATIGAAARHLPPGRRTLAVVGGLASLVPEAAGRFDRVVPAGTALDGARLLAEGAAPLHLARAMQATRADTPDRLDVLATEGTRPGLEDLDRRPPGLVVRLAVEGERAAASAWVRALPALERAGEGIAARMRAGGRLFTLGAGTPGRLAVLDAAELGPTFDAPPGLVIPLLAGGLDAMVNASEGAEDDPHAASLALDAHGLGPGDAVVGIAASGRTPFVLGGLQHAAMAGALTVAIVNNAGSPIAASAAIAVEILTGPELIAGSTRMTAGTVQKIALNALSTAAMVALGKTYGARMVDVRATNEKLRRRALRIVREVAGVDEAKASSALQAAGGGLKPALLMLLAGIDAPAATARLAAHGGRLRDALGAGGR